MYRIIVLIVLVLLIIAYVRIHKPGAGQARRLPHRFSEWWERIQQAAQQEKGRFGVWRYAFYLLTGFFFILLALSGFIPTLLFGDHLSGTLLILHVTAAPFFVLSLMLFLLFRAHFQQFDADDFSALKTFRDERKSAELKKLPVQTMDKLLFWLFAVITLPAILSMIFSMYPFIGTEGQQWLLNIHRYSVLLLLIIAALHFMLRRAQ
jgi:hypothetical protein